jgi:DNA primase
VPPQDPYTLIGCYVPLDSRGMGCCPFGEHHDDGRDTHPSFRVYMPATPGGCCWHCYTWGKGGNVFNFLALYLGLDARTLWSRMQAGEVFV